MVEAKYFEVEQEAGVAREERVVIEVEEEGDDKGIEEESDEREVNGEHMGVEEIERGGKGTEKLEDE